MTELQGRTVLIAGASRGIGAEAARAFAAAGANVALIARSREAVADLAGELGADRALAIPCDVRTWWEVEAAVDAVLGHFGRLDVLVNNAGVIQPIAALSQADVGQWDMAIDINLKGVFHGMRAALPAMLAHGSGTILNVSSGAAVSPLEGWSAYCASKAGALMLTRMGDAEYRAKGIRVLGLSPGTVATDMQREIKASGINRVSEMDWSDHIPPAWPAQALVWMCGVGADPWLGQDVSLRDPEIRAKVGLPG